MKIRDYIDVSLDSKALNRIGAFCGWAPGAYYGKCSDCDGEMIAAKRAMQCLPCAIISLKAMASYGKPAEEAMTKDETV